MCIFLAFNAAIVALMNIAKASGQYAWEWAGGGLSVIVALYAGNNGNEWVRRKRKRRGYVQTATLKAESRRNALALVRVAQETDTESL